MKQKTAETMTMAKNATVDDTTIRNSRTVGIWHDKSKVPNHADIMFYLGDDNRHIGFRKGIERVVSWNHELDYNWNHVTRWCYLDDLLQSHESQSKRIEELEKALGFYAGGKHFVNTKDILQGTKYPVLRVIDRGETAQNALNQKDKQ